MRPVIALFASAALLAMAGAAQAASVEVRDAVVRVTVVPEDRNDVKVEFLTTNPKLPLEVRTQGGATVIDGGLNHRIASCHGPADHPSAWVHGVGHLDSAAIPQVVIHTPRAVNLSSSGVVYGSIGRSGSLDLQDSGCSDWTIADVAGDATVRESGKGELRMGATGRMDLHLSGAANIHAVRVRQSLNAMLSGAGGVRIEQLDGQMDAHVSGAGRIHVEGGHASAVHASVSGIGGVDFGGVADTLDAQISGLGSVRVSKVTGQVNQSVSGIGHVTVNQGPV